MSSKKAFDLDSTSVFVALPEELCIIGGKILPKDERGPLDTAHLKGEHDLWDERIHNDITDESVANIDYYGVLEAIVITKDPVTGLPTVVDGRGRVRRARRANLLRAKRGEPPIKLECKNVRSKGARLMGMMIALNEVRTDDDSLVRMEKAKRLLERGVSEADAALTFGMDVNYFRQLLAYDDTATSEVKEAVAKGELTPTAAVEMVKAAKTPDVQRKALAAAKVKAAATGKKTTVKAAVEAVKTATGKASAETGAGMVPSRRELNAFGKQIAAITEPADDARILLEDEKGVSGIEVTQAHLVDAFYLGIEAALDIVAGKSTDKALLSMLAKARKSIGG